MINDRNELPTKFWWRSLHAHVCLRHICTYDKMCAHTFPPCTRILHQNFCVSSLLSYELKFHKDPIIFCGVILIFNCQAQSSFIISIPVIRPRPSPGMILNRLDYQRSWNWVRDLYSTQLSQLASHQLVSRKCRG